MKLKPFEIVWYDEDSGEYLHDRPDDPSNPLHPISLGAAVDLTRHLKRYEDDRRSEKGTTTL